MKATERQVLVDVVTGCPSYLYTEVPTPATPRYVFVDRVCLSLSEAADYARQAPFTKAQIPKLARGFEFTHESFLDLDWHPSPGQKYTTDAPKAVMVVTSVSRTAVSYRYASDTTTRGRFWLDRVEFEARYMGANYTGGPR